MLKRELHVANGVTHFVAEGVRIFFNVLIAVEIEQLG
jgi:hypothetical protein